MINSLPVGKLPQDLLGRLLEKRSIKDERIILGPGVGMDCAVIDNGPSCLVFKSDPITFATDELGWYAVQINTNDIVTTGALPRWLLMTLLLPEEVTSTELVEEIFEQVYRASDEIGIVVIGGHTEITYGLNRPIIVVTLVGEVNREDLITPRGCSPGDYLLLTKGVPIEGTTILAREFPERLSKHLTRDELSRARNFLKDPGISVLRDAQIAISAGKITAMHDPTEGGIAAALWELAAASSRTFVIDPYAISIPSLSGKVCQALKIDPFSTIASGALLMSVRNEDAKYVCAALEAEGILCAQIGYVEDGPPVVFTEEQNTRRKMVRPTRDEIARLYER
ncbi:MAG: AIR synthase family protein [Anaerolineales bacterium]|nr:AIR synthase family protein [Anaerolineales bacterium]